jgi:hypothetical protein
MQCVASGRPILMEDGESVPHSKLFLTSTGDGTATMFENI